MVQAKIKHFFRPDFYNIFKWLLFPVAVIVIFYHLGSIPFIHDEAETATYARQISAQNNWLPKIWDNRALIVQYEDGHDVTRQFFPMMQSWGQFYLARFSYLVTGAQNTFSGRAAFAVCGLFFLVIMYQLIRKTLGEQYKKLSLFLCYFILLSYPFLAWQRLPAIIP